MRLTVLLGLLANLFAAVGDRHGAAPAGLLALRGRVAFVGQGRRCSGRRWPPAEVFLAKLRLFRVPELLAGSFVLALLAVAASFFLA